jgi:hypothetical protein
MIFRKNLSFVFLLAVFACFNRNVFGCVCPGDPDITVKQYIDDNLKRADLVFSGQMEKLEYQSVSKAEIEKIKSNIRHPIVLKALENDSDFKRVFYSFKPNLFWKGNPKDRILIFSTKTQTLISDVTVGFSTCAFSFQTGENYLVFAKKNGDFFDVNGCNATGKLSRSQDALEILGKGKKFKPWYIFW